MKIAVITGASSGMGREMVLQINDRIPNVDELWLIGRRRERLEALDRMLTKRTRIFALDLLTEAALSEYAGMLSAEQPEIVFLVNAAGFGCIGSVEQLSCAEQLNMIDVNVRALTAMCRFSLPYMAKHSRIINFASSASFLPQADFAVYAASKSYVLSFSRALNEELISAGRDCRVLAVCPGPVKTEFFDLAERSGKIPVYKYLFMADCRKVVKLALMDSVLKKDVSVYGGTMKLLRLGASLLPHGLLLKAERMANYASDKLRNHSTSIEDGCLPKTSSSRASDSK